MAVCRDSAGPRWPDGTVYPHAAAIGGAAAVGPGRVDTFNPYKLIQFLVPFDSLTPQERIGTSDFPAIFNQGPREGMHLHWDGNNTSLAERNLSAALGAGVTVESVDHASIERVACGSRTCIRRPARTIRRGAGGGRPHRLHGAVRRMPRLPGQQRLCLQGRVDRPGRAERETRRRSWRLDSYTQRLRDQQMTLFAGTPYQFRYFTKTNGYANLPLDGLWLRAPYLHNGSVPTLADLLLPPDQRPKAFVRGLDVLDAQKGGFQAPPCMPGNPTGQGFCYDTTQPGNGNGGHLYGTTLSPEDRSALLSYLMTF